MLQATPQSSGVMSSSKVKLSRSGERLQDHWSSGLKLRVGPIFDLFTYFCTLSEQQHLYNSLTKFRGTLQSASMHILASDVLLVKLVS